MCSCKRLIPLLLFAGSALVSCDQIFFKPDPANDPVSNFETLWQEVDEGYSFFEFKQIDWDSIYNVFRPRVEADMTSFELFDLMSEMLYSLRDGHVNLRAPFNFSRNWEWYLGYPDNYDFDLLERNYWDGKEWYTGPFIHTFLADSSIGYVRYSSFGNPIAPSHLGLIFSRFQSAKGLILDLRDNGGGSRETSMYLASRFADQRRLATRFVVKTGPAHDDFCDPFEVYISPEGETQYTKPVIILTNRSCYSATNSFVAYAKAFPHVKVVGDWTGGGGGIPVGGELPNGWSVRYSATQSFLPNGFNIEGGISPDIEVDMLEEDQLEGVDTILERAMEELR